MWSIVLGSSSSYRQQLLKRIVPHFKVASPNIDESPIQGESVTELVKRLSIDKANAVAIKHPQDWVIGSDQVAEFCGQVIGKPLTVKKAISQLTAFSGHTVNFLTGVCIVNHQLKICRYDLQNTQVKFKTLTEQRIIRYLELEQPFDCAGSFKIESMGPLLFESVISDDPTALQGLPLIKLIQLFEQENIDLLELISEMPLS